MAPKITSAQTKKYLVHLEGEYYTHPRSEAGRERYKEILTLSEDLAKFGYLYACKKFLTEKFSKNPNFRRMRTCSIVDSSVVGAPNEPVTVLELMSFEKLLAYVQKNIPDINTDLYYLESMKDELIQSVYDYREDPTAAKDHQKWKESKQHDRIEMHKLLRELNMDDDTL